MTSKQFFASLSVFDLTGLPVTIWLGIVPVSVGWILIIMTTVPLWQMMRGDLRAMVREIFSL